MSRGHQRPVTLFQLPMKSVFMDILVVDVPDPDYFWHEMRSKI
jgi:hypothetical protein